MGFWGTTIDEVAAGSIVDLLTAAAENSVALVDVMAAVVVAVTVSIDAVGTSIVVAT